ELGAPAPAANFHAEGVGLVQITQVVSGGAVPRHPEVVALEQDAALADVGDVDGELAFVVDVAETDVHAALGPLGDAAPLAHLFKLRSLVVGIEFGHAVVVGQEKVRVAGATQVGGPDCQRPAGACYAHLLGDI